MAGICCGVVGDTEATAVSVAEPSSHASRRRRLELITSFKVVADAAVQSSLENRRKRQKLDLFTNVFPPEAVESASARCDCNNAVRSGKVVKEKCSELNDESVELKHEVTEEFPKFGMTSVCGGRRDMEDAVSVKPSFTDGKSSFFGVFDGHGCSHVAIKCRERLHDIVKEEIGSVKEECVEWNETMRKSFERMDKEVEWWCNDSNDGDKTTAKCRCELQTPQCDAVGSTAVVALVTQDKIVVSNCGDSRAVLCRKGVAVALSSDHKPDRPDELLRIEGAGGRVIYWDGARVLGVLAMSRAIGDNYLKPYVISEPEVTVTERTEEDECLILGSDGLWDVVSNETACGVARMCLRAERPPSPPGSPWSDAAVRSGSVESSDKACSDASILLTKLALARHSTDNVSVVVIDLRRKNQNQNQHHQQSSNSK